MTPNPAPRRPGVSLIEVLIALFVMAIGLLALLTLFPLGAMQVGQALRDDRCTQLARQADGYLRQTWRNDIVRNPAGTQESYFWAMDDPYFVNRYDNSGPFVRLIGSNTPSPLWYTFVPANSLGIVAIGTAAADPINNPPTPFTLTGGAVRTPPVGVTDLLVEPWNTNPQLTANNNLASYPVMLDPAGLDSRGAAPGRAWLGYPAAAPTTLTTRLPRRTCVAVHPYPPAVQTFRPFEFTALTDDMTFAMDGAPDPLDLGRQGRYTYAAVVQRPRNSDRTVANLWILVFDGRPVLPQPGDELVVAPVTAAGAGSRTVTVDLPNRNNDTDAVLLRRGGWLIDGTIDNPAATASPRRHFYPYRVSGYTPGDQTGVAAGFTRYDVDLETPLERDLTTAAGTPASQLYFLAGLTEVFTRPPLRPDTNY